MKFKLFEIREMKEALLKVVELELPIKYAWRLTQLVDKFEEENAKIEKFRISLVKKYGTRVVSIKTSNDTVINDLSEEELKNYSDYTILTDELKVSTENIDTFKQEMNSLLEEEINVDFEKIKVSDLGEYLLISPKELYLLKKIFE